MIQSDIVFDFSKMDKLVSECEAFPQTVKKAAAFGFNQRIRLGLLAQLRKTPKRRYWKGADFVNDASRRAFFAKTKGKGYERTGKLAAGWRVDVTTANDAIAFSISNPVSYEKFVTGNRQVFGHEKTGWPLSGDIFEAWKPRVVAVLSSAITDAVRQGFKVNG